MDQAINPQVLQQRQRRRWMIGAVVGFAIVGASWGVNRIATQSASLSELRVSELRVAKVDNTINASGIVIPVREEQLSSPAQTRVTKVVAKAGQTVKAGDLLMVLDDQAIRVAIDNLREQISQQEIRVQTLSSELDAQLKKIASEIELLELDLQSNKVKLARYQKLGATGITSQVDLQAAELAVKRNEVQLRQHKESLVDTRKTTHNNIESARLQRSIFQKQMELQQSLLAQTQVKAPFDGLLTWAMTDEGASVNTGQLIAKVSELNNFRVEASVSDFYARYLNPGQAVRVEYSGQVIRGEVQTILPEIQNGTVKLIVSLAEPHHPALRHKLRVETNIVTDQKEQALVADAGPAINGKGRQEVFVLQDGTAVKRTVEFGMADGKHVEVLASSGLKAGDKLIVSDVSKFKHLDSFRVR
ncbi:HlyD family efflux transporter periplasmic adaptor subunit [Undibacterium cyanobacteriorum]|uniref:HlyD family efflux transporter periplasmic adaptor subunit n=1 Tax=Undibacterium cyanobacteriorum TaxID=3073561 RepID=A0ABY9RKX7_9BURK|nr:HlyD family efflux transporter periplasmic adaptor subunit [Undibacterium sp. 20NA77.5]WMW81877.1 HlyD family efflux transporter periplasmic adaptor subunit [Undibacterium sp. 20NA77.5]